MTKSVTAANSGAPGLDELLASENPAWLWDGDRTSIVWANNTGIAWFGAETLFDLIEFVFDTKEPSVAAIKSLSSKLSRGDKASLDLSFAGANDNSQLNCQCYVHALTDGRSGLLVCADGPQKQIQTLSPDLQEKALGALPMPVCIVAGDGGLIYSNAALIQLLPAGLAIEIVEGLIEKVKKAGAANGLEVVESAFGQREVRIVARQLKNAERSADDRFLLVMQDVTERRALEKTLLASLKQLTQNSADADMPVAESTTQPANELQADETEKTTKTEILFDQNDAAGIDNEVAKALAALRQEIETQKSGGSDKAVTAVTSDKVLVQKAENEPAKPTPNDDEIEDSVPDIVSATLNELPQPLVLLDHSGKLLFANNTCVKIMGVKNWPEIGEITTLIDALAVLEGDDGEISTFTAEDEAVNFDVIISQFPWKDGPVYQATLSPGSDGEEADNRRSGGSKKKMKKLKKRKS